MTTNTAEPERHLSERVARLGGVQAVKIMVSLKHHRGDRRTAKVGWEATITFVRWIENVTVAVVTLAYETRLESMDDVRALLAGYDDQRVLALVAPDASTLPRAVPDHTERPILRALLAIDDELKELGKTPNNFP